MKGPAARAIPRREPTPSSVLHLVRRARTHPRDCRPGEEDRHLEKTPVRLFSNWAATVDSECYDSSAFRCGIECRTCGNHAALGEFLIDCLDDMLPSFDVVNGRLAQHAR